LNKQIIKGAEDFSQKNFNLRFLCVPCRPSDTKMEQQTCRWCPL